MKTRSTRAPVLALLVALLLVGAVHSFQSSLLSVPARRIRNPLHEACVEHGPRLYASNNGSEVAAGGSSSSSLSIRTAKNQLLELISGTPRNAVTPRALTDDILKVVQLLEANCPTNPAQVVEKLGGTWELLWTAQDRSSPDANRGPFSWVNPLENQSFSSNPTGGGGGGRSNPVLPQPIQDRLEASGLLGETTRKSTQAIDVQKKQARNVVSLNLFGKRKASVTVGIDLTPDAMDLRKLMAKFSFFRFVLQGTKIDFTLPLAFGPQGWIRTTYIDDNFRITRGQKGSVFVLSRPSAKLG